MSKVNIKRVQFESEGKQLVGNLYVPENNNGKGIVVSGSWTTVKEQMAGGYAERFANEGFIALTFDARNYGESEGDVMYFESPDMKIEDINNATTYLLGLSGVDSVSLFGVCAGAGYSLVAASQDDRVSKVVTAASWIHDEEAVKLFYGGEEGVNAKIEAAQKAKKLYADSGEITYIPTISTTDESAAMFGPYDYYLNEERGAVKEWSNDKFAVATWEDWLTYNPRPAAKNLNKPTLMIHSDGAVLPEYTKVFFEEIATEDKKLVWVDTELPSPFHQFNFYDQEAEMELVIKEAVQFL